MLISLVLAGCASGPENQESSVVPASSASDAGVSERRTPQVRYDANYDETIKEIFDLADRDRWEEAEKLAMDLYSRSEQDPTAARIYSWVTTQQEKQRAQAVEDRIREIDSDNSVFNPTVQSLLTEEKDRGLPPRKDLRDAIEQIEATRYVPESYGRTIRHQGLMQSTEDPGSARMTELLNKPVSIHLDDVTLETIIFQIGNAEGVNFVADKSLPAFQKKLSVNFDRVKLKEFLDYVSRNLGVSFQIGGDLIWIQDAADSENALEETRFYRLREGFIMPARFADDEPTRVEQRNKDVVTTTITEKLNLFVRDGAPDQPYIEQAIQQFFTGKYLIDFERNLIMARGTRDQLELLERIIREFDQPVQQVLIEARFITVNEPAFMKLGVVWETGRNLLTAQQSELSDFTGLAPDSVALPIQEVWTNILGRENLSATLSALEQSGESQTLSAPRITLVNNLPATISDGKVQYYYEEYQVKQTVFERGTTSSLVPSGKPAKLTSGVQLDVVASISGDGENILLGLHPKVSQEVQLVTFATLTDVDENGNPVSTFDIRLPEARTQELSTRVNVRSGETVVMGGVLEREQTTFVESVPLLGNLPVIGTLFRRRTEVDAPRYLLIFVTATIISESGEFVLPASSGAGPAVN